MIRSLYEEKFLLCLRSRKGYLTRFPVPLIEAEPMKKSNYGDDAFCAAEAGVLRPLLALSRSRLLKELDAKVNRAVKAKERHLEGLAKQLENNAGAELFKLKGELLLANLGAVPPRASSVALREWESGATLEIDLDPKLSPTRNAERYFKKYKKAHVAPQKIKEEIASLQSAIVDLREQMELLGSIEDPVKLEESVRDVMDWISPSEGKAKKGQTKIPVPPHMRFEVEGRTILVGLSARGNRYVTFKLATGDDLWLHAHDTPGAHVIVKGAKGREELENSEALFFAASLAAFHSRGKGSSSVQVDYTERRYVRSVPGAALALVTYVKPGTLRADPERWKSNPGNSPSSKVFHDADGFHGQGDL
jgi:predicted ribosome quality control (RQC) complex YloA/Tae2 family protein